MAYDRFTFHLDPSGGQTGFKEAQQARAQAGIGLSVMCADTYGPIQESHLIAQQYNVPFTGIWRPTTVGQNNGFDFDVVGNNYTLPVQQAADSHYAAMNQVSPPEMDKQVAWRLYFNEIDKNKLNYCAHVSRLIAEKHVADGTRAAFLALNSGEPEQEQWEQPEVLSFLRYASQHPHQIALALHEYSFSTNIKAQFPHLIGRFQALKQVCDRYGIDFSSLTIFITEFGHGSGSGTFPSVEQALLDIDWAAELYRPFNNIRLVAYWLINNTDSWDGLGRLTPPMIPPLTARTLANAPYPPYTPNGGGEQPPSPPECIPSEDYRAVVDLVPQNTTAAEMAEVVTSILQSKGTVTHSHNDARKVAALGNERSLVRIWNPARQPYAIPAMQEWNVAYEVKLFGGGDVPVPPPNTYDLLAYMKADNGFHAELQYTWDGGGTHPIQTQYAQDGVFYYVKGHSGEYEMIYADDRFIYRGIDTSEAPNRFYTQNTLYGADTIYGAIWAKRHTAVGETITKTPWVEHWFKGSPPTFDRAAQVRDTLTLKAHHSSYVFPSGVVVQDVLFLTWNGTTEGYYFARGKGLVGFVGNGGQSYISEIHTNRPNLVRNPVPEWENRPRYYHQG